MEESPPWRIHDAGGINLEVKCPTHKDRLVIVPMVHLKKMSIPGTEIICTCCEKPIEESGGVTQIFANSCIWVYKGIKNDETLQGRGKVGPRIFAVLEDVELWDSLVVASVFNEDDEDDCGDGPNSQAHSPRQDDREQQESEDRSAEEPARHENVETFECFFCKRDDLPMSQSHSIPQVPDHLFCGECHISIVKRIKERERLQQQTEEEAVESARGDETSELSASADRQREREEREREERRERERQQERERLERERIERERVEREQAGSAAVSPRTEYFVVSDDGRDRKVSFDRQSVAGSDAADDSATATTKHECASPRDGRPNAHLLTSDDDEATTGRPRKPNTPKTHKRKSATSDASVASAVTESTSANKLNSSTSSQLLTSSGGGSSSGSEVSKGQQSAAANSKPASTTTGGSHVPSKTDLSEAKTRLKPSRQKTERDRSKTDAPEMLMEAGGRPRKETKSSKRSQTHRQTIEVFLTTLSSSEKEVWALLRNSSGAPVDASASGSTSARLKPLEEMGLREEELNYVTLERMLYVFYSNHGDIQEKQTNAVVDETENILQYYNTHFNADTAYKEINTIFEKITITPSRLRSNFTVLEVQIPLIKYLLKILPTKVLKKSGDDSEIAVRRTPDDDGKSFSRSTSTTWTSQKPALVRSGSSLAPPRPMGGKEYAASVLEIFFRELPGFQESWGKANVTTQESVINQLAALALPVRTGPAPSPTPIAIVQPVGEKAASHPHSSSRKESKDVIKAPSNRLQPSVSTAPSSMLTSSKGSAPSSKTNTPSSKDKKGESTFATMRGRLGGGKKAKGDDNMNDLMALLGFDGDAATADNKTLKPRGVRGRNPNPYATLNLQAMAEELAAAGNKMLSYAQDFNRFSVEFILEIHRVVDYFDSANALNLTTGKIDTEIDKRKAGFYSTATSFSEILSQFFQVEEFGVRDSNMKCADRVTKEIDSIKKKGDVLEVDSKTLSIGLYKNLIVLKLLEALLLTANSISYSASQVLSNVAELNNIAKKGGEREASRGAEKEQQATLLHTLILFSSLIQLYAKALDDVETVAFLCKYENPKSPKEKAKSAKKRELSVWDISTKDMVQTPGTYKACKVEEIVVRVTLPLVRLDLQFAEILTTTYIAFSDPNELFEVLSERFFPPEKIEKNIPKEELRDLRMKTLKIFKLFLAKNYFHIDETLKQSILEFCNKRLPIALNAEPNDAHINNLRDSLNSRALFEVPAEHKAIPKIIQKDAKTSADSIVVFEMKPKDTILLFDETMMAEQLTLIELDIFRRIQALELMGQAWSKSKYQTLARNVADLITRPNRISHWVATQILLQHKLRDRVKVVTQFILIAQKLDDLRNYNTLMGVLAGLNSSAISRLHNTHNQLDKSVKRIFEELNEKVNPELSFKKLRGSIELNYQSGLPCLPFIGMFLTDLTFIDEGNPDFIAVDGSKTTVPNFPKQQMVYKAISNLLAFQINMKDYGLQKLPVHTFLETVPSMHENDLWELSQEREPRVTSG